MGGASRTFGYDQADRLISATTGVTTSSYGYDGDGLRQSKTVTTTQGTTTTAETWDTAEGLPALLQDGATGYIAGPDGLPIEQIDSNGNVQYYLHDQLGSTRALLDSGGNTVATYSYDAYGNPTGRTGNATTPFGYAGAYTDAETGLQYLQARYYDPATQQFVSVDPLVDQTGQPYAYTYADPLNMVDPTGLDSGCNGASGQGIGRVFSALGDLGCNLGEAKDTALGTAGTLAAPPCDVLAGGCRLPTGQETVATLGRATDATGAAIATTASDAGAALRPGCVPVLQNCRWDTPQEELRTDYGIFAGLYGGVNALTFGGEANLGAYAGLDNNALQCTPEFEQGSRLAIAGTVALGGYGAARSALGLVRGLRTGMGAQRASFGFTTSTDYRETFFQAHPQTRGQVFVHHAVEQQVLTRYPRVVSPEQMHSLENLRGIPNNMNNTVHLSQIRRAWNTFYRAHPNGATAQELLDEATRIDDEHGHLFDPPVR